MATKEAKYSLESGVRGHHVYKYIWRHHLSERLSVCADVGNAQESVSYYVQESVSYYAFLVIKEAR